MASYSQPTEDLPIFDPSVFAVADIPLTQASADLRYLRYPVSQGGETINGTLSVAGTATFSSNQTNSGQVILQSGSTQTGYISADSTTGLQITGVINGSTANPPAVGLTRFYCRDTTGTTVVSAMADYSGFHCLSLNSLPNQASSTLSICPNASRSAPVNIATGGSNTSGAQVNIATGTNSASPVAIANGTSSTSLIQIGRSNAISVQNGATTVATYNVPFTIGYNPSAITQSTQLGAQIASSGTSAIPSFPASAVNLYTINTLPAGVWMVNGYCNQLSTSTGVFRLSISATSATHNLSFATDIPMASGVICAGTVATTWYQAVSNTPVYLVGSTIAGTWNASPNANSGIILTRVG